MKYQVLFVDDEALILEGLQRTMRPMRHEWDMTFLDTANAALEFMTQTPVDVIVSDMRMPAMNGAQLLGEVMKRHPKTIRLILSGHADQDLILQCVGSTHQFLSKPCDPEQLRATVQRAMDLESKLKHESLQKLIGRMEHLPSVPALYSAIVDRMHNPETTLDDIGGIISQDMGMTAKILKLVNSAFFGLRRQVASPTEAVAYLGIDTIKSLVLSMHAFAQFEGAVAPGFSIAQLWEHSMQTAAMAKTLTQFQTENRKLVDEAFVSGLLHDAGKAALAFNFPNEYGAVLAGAHQTRESILQAEKEMLGATHAEIGGYLLGLWGLPTPIVEAIALHHEPSLSAEKMFSPLTAVHLANAFLHAERGDFSLADQDYLNRLHLTERLAALREHLLKTANPHVTYEQ